jgi:hypothetical protein
MRRLLSPRVRFPRLGFSLAVVLPLVLLGCGETSDDDDDDDDDDTDTNETDSGPYCDEVETLLGLSDETGMGFTGGDLLAELPLDAVADVLWADGPISALEWGVTPTVGTLRYVESTEVYPETDGPSNSIGVYCPDYVAVDGILELVSDDGRLNESMPFAFMVTEENADAMVVEFSDELDPDGLNGSFDIADFANPDDYDTLRLFLSGQIQGGELSGGVSGQGEGSDGNTAWAESIEVASIESSATR